MHKQPYNEGFVFLFIRFSSHVSLCKQLRRDGSAFLFIRVLSHTSLRKQPHSGWSVGRAGLANEMSLPCLRHTKRKQGRRSWSLQSLPIRDSNRPKPAQSSLFRRCRETNPDGVERGDVPLRQGRLISFANPVLPTDQPLQGCLLIRQLHSFPLYFLLLLFFSPYYFPLTPFYSPPYYLQLLSLLLHLFAFETRRLRPYHSPPSFSIFLPFSLQLKHQVSTLQKFFVRHTIAFKWLVAKSDAVDENVGGLLAFCLDNQLVASPLFLV